MQTKPSFRIVIPALLFLGLLVSGYLLIHHLHLVSGQAGRSDLCSTVFGRGCNSALTSPFSSILGIPLGGWGLVYFTVLSLLYFFSRWFPGSIHAELIQSAFWITFAGIFFSLFYIFLMIRFPVLFCPFCSLFHLINFTLFFLLKKSTGLPFSSLFKNLWRGFSFVVLARPLSYPFERWKWLPFGISVLAGVVVLQFVQIENRNQSIRKLSQYDPLQEIEKYEARDPHEFVITPGDPVLGPADAPVTLVVFSDFQCSACQMLSSNFHDLVKTNQGKLKICFKYFPLGQECNPEVKQEMHPLACEAARAAVAAHHQGMFWAYHDSLFQKLEGGEEDPVVLFHIARSMNLDMTRFEADYRSDSCRQVIASNIGEALALKLDGTPAAFLNGRQVFDMRVKSLNLLIKYLAH